MPLKPQLPEPDRLPEIKGSLGNLDGLAVGGGELDRDYTC